MNGRRPLSRTNGKCNAPLDSVSLQRENEPRLVIYRGGSRGADSELVWPQVLAAELLCRRLLCGFLRCRFWRAGLLTRPRRMRRRNQQIALVLVGIALFAGVVAYAIHRSLLYPFFEWFFSGIGVTCRRRFPLISENSCKSLKCGWSSGGNNAKARFHAARKALEDMERLHAPSLHLCPLHCPWCAHQGIHRRQGTAPVMAPGRSRRCLPCRRRRL